jgi:cytochrome c2
VAVWATWHLLSAIFIPFILSELRLQTPLWQLHATAASFLVGLALTHLTSALALTWLAMGRSTVSLLAVFVTVGVSYALLFAAHQSLGLWYSRSVLVMAVGASLVFGVLSIDMMQRLYKVLLPALSLTTAVMAGVVYAGWASDDGVKATTFYRVRFVSSGLVVPSAVHGGALDVFGTGVLVASGDGALYYVDKLRAAGGAVRRLRYDIPLNRDRYRADKPVNRSGSDPFRVTDILVEDRSDRFRLFASHHYWKREERCVGIRVSVTEAPRAAFLNGTADIVWVTLYESQPCLKLGDLRFIQSGGRMVKLDERSLLLTVGDHVDSGSRHLTAPQSLDSDYGKTVRINLQTGASEVYTLGHRNPQGLCKSSDGRIWLTEHGPAGGDELNLVQQGSNYGWPLATYGTAYNMPLWPLSERDGYHDGYVEPWFAWVPSIAVSGIVSLQRDLFPIWKGDLLVTSLKGHVIRLRAGPGRIVFAEPIYATNTRIRDVVEAADGRIVLFQDDGSIGFLERVPTAADADVEAVKSEWGLGEEIFRACQDCHLIGSGSNHGTGPDLRGILGRDIASAARFEYSVGLRLRSGSWTKERLNQFLANPDRFAPGTSMKTGAIEDPMTRRILIEYLASHN